VCSQQRLVEQADDAPLVLRGVLADRARVLRVGQVPVLDRSACGVAALGGDLDQDVGAGRDAERSDPAGLDVVELREEVERAVDVLAPAPAVVAGSPVALASRGCRGRRSP
jgi:hypothetical protein